MGCVSYINLCHGRISSVEVVSEVDRGASYLVVGHVDLLGLFAGRWRHRDGLNFAVIFIRGT